MSRTPVLSAATKPYRPLVGTQEYLDSMQRQSCLASRDSTALAKDLCSYALTEIRRAEKWGLEPILLKMVLNAHIGIPSNPDDPDSPPIYPEGPVTVYRFMQSPDCEIDGTWDRTGQYNPTSNIGCKPPWSMGDIPDATVMRAAAMASRHLRSKSKQKRAGTSLEYMNEIVQDMSNAEVPSKIFLHVMKAEGAACREYITNKITDEQSHHAMNTFFHALDIMTARGPSIASDDIIREVPQHYFDQWDQYQSETEAAEMSYFDYLVRVNPHYASVAGVQRAMERVPHTDEVQASSATRLSNPYDYVAKHKAMEEATRVDLQATQGQSARADMLSRLASELRGASSKAKCVDEDEPLEEWEGNGEGNSI
jgi:hypothetical protein